MSRVVLVGILCSAFPLSTSVAAEETVSRFDTSLSLLSGLGRSKYNKNLITSTKVVGSTDAANVTTSEEGLIAQPSVTVLKDRVRLELQDAAIYGMFTSSDDEVSRVATSSSIVGVGIEHELDRGLALNLEIFQGRAHLGRRTKAALKLRLRF